MLDKTKFVHIINPTLASKIGTETALILQQMKYWISKCGKQISASKELFIYNSLHSWKDQFPYMSEYKIRKSIKYLEDNGIIKSVKVNAHRWNHTKWYTIDHQKYSLLSEDIDNSALDCKNTSTKIPSNRNLKMFSKQKNSSYRSDDTQQIIKTKNNYTNKSSYKKEEVKLKNNKKPKKLAECTNIEKIIPSKEQKDIAKQMVQVWNDSFECSLSPVKAFMNRHVVVQLNKILQTKFENNLETWKLYAQAVNSSRFLMGEKETKSNFKAQFLWLIKEETIDSIQNGAYGVGDRLLDSETVDENLKICKKEVQQMVQEKVASQIQEKTSNETEEQEFSKYLINREYEKDGDKYLIQKHMESIGSKYMYGGYITPSHVFYSGNEKYKKRLFQSYLMKKYYGIDETGISSSLNHVTQGVERKSMLLKFKKVRDQLRSGVLQDSDRNEGLIGLIAERTGEGISTTYVLN